MVKMLLKIILYHVNINSAEIKKQQEQQVQSSVMQHKTLLQNVHSTICNIRQQHFLAVHVVHGGTEKGGTIISSKQLEHGQLLNS
jgi:hypothetical protein